MAAVAHSPAFAKKVGTPQSVGQDFNEADKGRKFGEGGSTMATKKPAPSAMTQMAASLAKPAPPAKAAKVRESGARPDLQRINSPKTNQGRNELFKEGGDTMASKMNPGMMAMMAKKKDGMHKMPDGKMMKNSAMKMADGGMPMKDGKPAFIGDGKGAMKHGGSVKKMAEGGMTDTAQDKAMVKKAFKQHDMQEHKGGKGTSLKLAKGGAFRSSANGIASKGKTKGTQVTMKKGGMC